MSQTGEQPASQRQWQLVRQGLDHYRAASLYPNADRVGTAPLLTEPDWLPTAPVHLADVELAWRHRDLLLGG